MSTRAPSTVETESSKPPPETEPFDLSNLGLRHGLYDLYRRLLVEAPVYHSPRMRGWYVSGHAFLTEAFRSPKLSANRFVPVFQALPEDRQKELRPLADSFSRWTLLLDPPDHTRMRTLVMKAFTPRSIRNLEPSVRQLVDEMLATGLERGSMEVIRDLAYPLPVTVIALMMGVPMEDRGLIKAWSAEISRFFGLVKFDRDELLRTQKTIVEMTDYLEGLVAARRRRPADDLISRLIEAREEGDVLDDAELYATLIMLVFAGHETTTNLIANAMLCLHDHPGERRRLRENPELAATAVEETMRFESPAQRVSRMAAEDFEIGGKEIRAGERVFLLMGAANRDPAAFDSPDTFDIGRESNRHLGFGWGTHYCIGAALGRLETQIALEASISRLGDYEIEGEIEWHPSSALRALTALPIRFEAR